MRAVGWVVAAIDLTLLPGDGPRRSSRFRGQSSSGIVDRRRRRRVCWPPWGHRQTQAPQEQSGTPRGGRSLDRSIRPAPRSARRHARRRLLLDGRRLRRHAPARRLRRRGHQDRGPHPHRHAPPAADLQGRAGAQLRRGGRSTPTRTRAGCSTTTAATSSASPSTCARRRAATLAERLIARSERRHRELRAGRDGALGPHLRAPARAVAAGDLRPHERLRPLRPARRVPQLRTGRAGGVRPVVHQRPARPGAVGLGPVVHGQPGGVLQLGGAADGDLPPQRAPARAPRSTCRRSRPASTCSGRCCSTSPSTATRAVRPDFPTGNRLEWPNAAPHGVYPAAARTAGSRSPCSTTPSGPVSVDALGDPDVGRRRALRHAGRTRFAHQDAPRRAPRRVDARTATATT